MHVYLPVATLNRPLNSMGRRIRAAVDTCWMHTRYERVGMFLLPILSCSWQNKQESN